MLITDRIPTRCELEEWYIERGVGLWGERMRASLKRHVMKMTTRALRNQYDMALGAAGVITYYEVLDRERLRGKEPDPISWAVFWSLPSAWRTARLANSFWRQQQSFDEAIQAIRSPRNTLDRPYNPIPRQEPQGD